MRAGSFDRRVAILRRVLVHDGLQRVETWQLLGHRSASRLPLPGNEIVEADRRRSVPRYSLWLRVDSLTRTLTAADAVAFNGQRFELTEPPREVERSRRQGIEILVAGTGESWAV